MTPVTGGMPLLLTTIACIYVAKSVAKQLSKNSLNWLAYIFSSAVGAIFGTMGGGFVLGALDAPIQPNLGGMLIWSVVGAFWGVRQGREDALNRMSDNPLSVAIKATLEQRQAEKAAQDISAPPHFADAAVEPRQGEDAPTVVSIAPEPSPRPVAKEPDTIQARQMEEAFYEQVATEMAARQVKKGLWAKALAQCDGSHERTKALYIKLRVQSLMDEAVIKAEEERQRAAETVNRIKAAGAQR